MNSDFIIKHKNVDFPNKPKVILVSNYDADNEIVNWGYSRRINKPTRSDVGVWIVKYKN